MKKILFNAEGSVLSTGYSRLYREIISRLHTSGKY